MKRSVVFIFFAVLLAITSILAPAPDWLTHISITNQGGQIGVDAADLAADTIDTSTTDNALPYSFQRNQIYAASRFWEGYSDGTDYVITSSLDGNTWETPDVIIIGETDGRSVSWWFDSENICLAYAPGTANAALQYRQYTPNDNGTLTALAGHDHWETALAADANKTYSWPYLCKDTSGYPVISYTNDTSGTSTPYVTKSAQNNGQWTSSTFNTQLSATDDATWRACVLPVSSQDLIGIYARDGQTIKSKIYDYSATSFLSENATTEDIEKGSYFSAVVTSDNVSHLVWLEDDSQKIQYSHYHSGGIAWETEETVYDGTSTTMAPVLSKTLDGALYCFWLGDNVTSHVYYKTCVNGVWDTDATDWHTESNVTANSDITSAYGVSTSNYIGVSWLTGTGSPYNVRFSALERSTRWLTGWANRSVIVNDGTHLTADVDNFTITLNVDNTTNPDIFTSLGSPDNRRKIAVTLGDGITELEVEIERWNPLDNTAVLHCGPTTIHDAGDTIYLYYDPSHAENPKVLNDYNPNVWNSNYKLVMNMENWNWENFKTDNYMIQANSDEGYNLLESSALYVPGGSYPYKLWLQGKNPAGEWLQQYHYDSADGLTEWNRRGGVGALFIRGTYLYNSENWTSPVKGGQLLDGAAYTNNTAELNDGDATEVALLPATPANDDAYLIGGASRFNFAKIDVSTAGVWDGTLTWKYYKGNPLLGGTATSGTNAAAKNYIVSSTFVCAVSDVANYISVYCDGNTNVRVAVFDNYGSGATSSPWHKLAESNSTACVAGWNWVALTSAPLLTKGNRYWVLANNDNASKHTTSFTTTGVQRRYVTFTYGAFPADYTSPTDYRATDTHQTTEVDCMGVYTYNSTAGWTNLSGVTDGTSNFETAGTNSITFTLPTDWTEATLNSITAYWIGGFVTGYSAITTQPKADKAWVVCKYWAYGYINSVAPHDQMNLFTAANETQFDLAASNVLHHSTTEADFDSYDFAGVGVWAEGATLYMQYGCSTQHTPEWPNWRSGGATSVADGNGNWGLTWTKQAGPEADKSWTFTGFGTNVYITCVSKAPLVKIGSTYYMLFISTPDNTPFGGIVSTQDIGLAKSTDMVNWTAVGGPYNPFLTRTKTWEYPTANGFTSAVMSNPWPMEVGGKLRVYYNCCHDDSTGGDAANPDTIGVIEIPLSAYESFSFPSGMRDSTINVNEPNGQFGAVTAPGYLGEARDFDGTDSFLRSSNITGINGATDFTIESVIQFDNTTNKGMIFTLADDNTTTYTKNNIYLGVYNQHIIFGTFFSDVRYEIGTSTYGGTGHFATGQWLYVAAVRSGSTMALYIYDENSTQLEKVTGVKSATALDAHYWCIGGWYTKTGAYAGKFYDGVADTVRFCTSAMSEAQTEAEAANFFGSLLPYSETELGITVSPDTWTEFYKESSGSHVHTLREDTWYSSDNDTNKDYFTLTNTGASSCDVLISSGDNWTGTGATWTVSPTGTPGNATIGIWAGLSTDSGYDRLVKPDTPANFLCTNVGTTHPTHDVSFGLLVYTCTSNGGNASMSGTVTLTAVVHT